MKKYLIIFGKVIAGLLAAFFILQATVFFAIKYGISDVGGEIDDNSAQYNELVKDLEEENYFLAPLAQASGTIMAVVVNGLPEAESIYGPRASFNFCKIMIAAEQDGPVGKAIFDAYISTRSEALLNNMLLAMNFRVEDEDSFKNALASCKDSDMEIDLDRMAKNFDLSATSSIFVWQNSEPWQIISEAIGKDKETIYEAAEKAGVQPRMLVSVAIVEQLRLYYTQRELFEKVFKPLKILASANKMAWGVMSIKEKMAIETEEHLHDQSSPYYLGTSTEALLDFPPDADIDKLRYDRLTDEKNHYYSYLYGALIIKQLETQWENAGYPIRYRPEISATLFNIGFKNSKPKAEPQVGGSTLVIDGQKYHFGSLAFEFYYSGVMTEEFPFE